MRSTRPARSEFAAFRYPAEVITLAVRWYLRYNPTLSVTDGWGRAATTTRQVTVG